MNQENQTRIDEDSERSLCTVTNDHHCLKKKKKKLSLSYEVLLHFLLLSKPNMLLILCMLYV